MPRPRRDRPPRRRKRPIGSANGSEAPSEAPTTPTAPVPAPPAAQANGTNPAAANSARRKRTPTRRRAVVQPGIRAADFGESWWAKRWIDALEHLGYQLRLSRGQIYARDGAVLSLDLQDGKMNARVQGSRPKPYKVSVGLRSLDDQQWNRAVEVMAGQAIFTAQLLSGEMPRDIEAAFNTARASLFPRRMRDLVSDCNCPDETNLCKHIAAVCYLIGNRLDEDPFLLFSLRGRDREEIVEALRARRAKAAAPSLEPAVGAGVSNDLSLEIEHFYQAGPDLAFIQPRIASPEVDMALLRRHGEAPALIEHPLRVIYRALSAEAIERIVGE